MNKSAGVKGIVRRHEAVLLAVLVLEWFYFNSVGRRFGTLDNTYDIVRHTVEIGLLALVMTPIILTGGIDLSVGSLLGLCAILFGKLWRDAHLPVWTAAIGTLGERCREIFRLKLQGFNFPEIQKQMRADSLNTIYTWDHRCRKQLLSAMGGRWEK